jgi:hypothetical protein
MYVPLISISSEEDYTAHGMLLQSPVIELFGSLGQPTPQVGSQSPTVFHGESASGREPDIPADVDHGGK